MSQKIEALKPCPFCGGTFVAQGASRDYISVWCDCGARGPEVKFPENCDPLPPIYECHAARNRRASQEAAVPSEEPVAWLGGENEKLCDDAAMRAWMTSFKRTDLCEKDRVRGAIEAFKRQAIATQMLASPAVAPVASVKEALDEALGLARLAATLTGCRGDDDYVAGVQAKIEVALSSIIPEDELPVWHVGSWGDGSTPPYLANIFCDAHEATIAAGILKEHAVAIVDAHNEALAALREAEVPSEEPVASKATAKICQACYGTGRGKGTSVTCSTCFGSGAVAIASPAVAPVASEAAWRITLRPDDRSIVDKLEFTFTQKDEYAAFVKAYRAKQSAWAITDICEYQASTAESACRAALSAIPGEEQ